MSHKGINLRRGLRSLLNKTISIIYAVGARINASAHASMGSQEQISEEIQS